MSWILTGDKRVEASWHWQTDEAQASSRQMMNRHWQVVDRCKQGAAQQWIMQKWSQASQVQNWQTDQVQVRRQKHSQEYKPESGTISSTEAAGADRSIGQEMSQG